MLLTMPNDMPESLFLYKNYSSFLRGLPDYQDQIESVSYFPAQAQQTALGYHGKHASLLKKLNIRPYRHQIKALNLLEKGKNIVIATATASGKSLNYQIPSLAAVMEGKNSLFLFPTKALSHDQLEKLQALAKELKIEKLIAAYDGDTKLDKRKEIRENAAIILTNPDMLHYGILAFHEKWAKFFENLKYLVVDEMHIYRGVFGSHVSNILQRFLRIATHYKAEIQIIAASATIANPAEHAGNLCAKEFEVINKDYAPKAAREFIFWQPPVVNKETNYRRSINTEAAHLAAYFIKNDLKSIFFCNSRKSAELLKRYTQNYLNSDEQGRILTYRAGYTIEDRQIIEAAFKKGDITVLTATSALELGVDIGGVDAVVMLGYPGSMTSLWQRVGRAGRSDSRALAMLIVGDNPLDEYYLQHPELITEGKAEKAIAEAHNSEIHPLHVACAAFEKPVKLSEGYVADWLEPNPSSQLVKKEDKFYYFGRYPHKKLSVRGSGGKRIKLKDGFGKTIGISDYASALRDLHRGAVYMHQGENYLVGKLDLEKGVAILLPHLEDYYTQTRTETEIEIIKKEFEVYGVNVGRVRVSTIHTSFVKKRYFRESVIDEELLDLPEVSYATQALWFSTKHLDGLVNPALLGSALHGLEHALIGLLPAFILCERSDIGGVSYPIYPATGEPTIFIYDGYPGGVGYTQAAATNFPQWLQAAYERLSNCPCKTGCPRCILSPKCGNGNQFLDKEAAKNLAFGLLSGIIDIGTIAP